MIFGNRVADPVGSHFQRLEIFIEMVSWGGARNALPQTEGSRAFSPEGSAHWRAGGLTSGERKEVVAELSLTPEATEASQSVHPVGEATVFAAIQSCGLW